MAATMAYGLAVLGRYQAAPALIARSMVTGSSVADTTITRTSGNALRNRSSASIPV
jgi:hypothetical protein